VINRGGEKISPAEVETALLQHPAVSAAVVFAMPHRTLQEEVAAAIMLEPGHEVDEPAVREHLGSRLAPFKVPRRVVVLPELPAGPTGKPIRAGLAERLGLGADSTNGGPPGPEARPLEARLAVLWGEALERPAGLDDDFFELGGDSLAALGLLAAIEEDLNVALELEALVEAPTPRLLGRAMLRAPYLERHVTRSRRDVIGVNVDGGLSPLFVVGGRPGYALRTLVVAREVADELPVYGLQPPGMAWDATGAATIPEMAAHYLARAREVQPHGPYRLLGSSFGGLLVFELALQLERAGEEVEFLGLVDTEPPIVRWRPDADSPPDFVEDLDPAPENGDGPPEEISAAANRVAAAHVEARQAYEITSRVRSELTFFLCVGDGVAAGADRRALWADATTGRFRLLPLPGLHARFDREPQFSALRDALRACLLEGPPAGLDPAQVFDRTYALESGPGGETLRNGDGSALAIEDGAMLGWARTLRSGRGHLMLRGWASDTARRNPADTVVAFMDGHFAGYSICGAPTERLAERLESPGLRHAGFRLRLEHAAGTGTPPVPRVFALSPDGRATELSVRSGH
jgi:thioesterase domain-containing protein